MKKRKFRIRHLLFAIVICYFGYVLVNQQLTIMRMKNDINKYSEQNSKLTEENENIKNQIDFAQTDEYKERLARERMGLIKPGETVYVIDEEE
jgi:cell division protein FtsB